MKTKKLLSCLFLLLGNITTYAYHACIDGIYYSFYGYKATVVNENNGESSNCYSGSVHIPHEVTYNGMVYEVNSISHAAFYGCTGLTSVTIPYGVTSIELHAFYGCTGLTSVTIPITVTKIGSGAFEGCTGLASISIPNSVTSIGSKAFSETAWYRNQPDGLIYVGKVAYCYKGVMPNNTQIEILDGTKYITAGAFRGCTGLTSVTIPNTVTTIGGQAFQNCKGLTSVTIPESVTSIGSYAFEGCSGSLTVNCSLSYDGTIESFYGSSFNSLIIGKNVTSIGISEFSTISGLESITVESENTIYDSRNNCNAIIKTSTNYLISGCKNTVIPNSVTGIAYEAFYGCTGLTSISVPNSVTSIQPGAFMNCTGLTSISLPNSVTSIQSGTFMNCTSLASVTFPNSVTSIEDDAFRDCSALTNVKVDRETPPSIYSRTFTNSANATLYVPAGSKAAYEAADYWKDFKRIIECIDGDVNGDGESDVVDVVDIARYVVGTPAETFVEILADINNNGEVNIADAVCLVNDIAGDQNFAKPMGSPRKPETTSDALMLTEGSNGLSLLLENQRDYTAFQFDLYVPEGMDVMQMMLNAQRKQKHQLLYNKVEEGHWRVAALSTSNRTFADNSGELLSFTLAGNANGDVVVSDIHFFTPDGEDCTFNDIRLQAGIVTDIQTAGNPQQTTDHPDVYDLSGRKIENSKWSNRQLPKGIYIVNGKKVIIK